MRLLVAVGMVLPATVLALTQCGANQETLSADGGATKCGDGAPADAGAFDASTPGNEGGGGHPESEGGDAPPGNDGGVQGPRWASSSGSTRSSPTPSPTSLSSGWRASTTTGVGSGITTMTSLLAASSRRCGIGRVRGAGRPAAERRGDSAHADRRSGHARRERDADHCPLRPVGHALRALRSVSSGCARRRHGARSTPERPGLPLRPSGDRGR